MIAGQAKGRRLSAPPGDHARPTGDRVREALFSMLDAHLGLDGTAVADLACGSGALGIEALSRGAKHCTFVDTSPVSLRVARANLVAVGLEPASATFVKDDLLRWARRQPPGSLDLVLVDPPYAWDGWPDLLAAVAGSAGAVAAESDREITTASGWASLRTRRHGSTVVTVLVADRDSES